MSSDLDRLIARIQNLNTRIKKDSLEIGRCLILLKFRCRADHEPWLPTLRKIGIHPTTADLYKRVAEFVRDHPEHLQRIVNLPLGEQDRYICRFRKRQRNRPAPETFTAINGDVDLGRVKILQGDNRVRMLELAPRIIRCCIGSPPFWRLRVYDVPNLVWGGDPNCEHDFKMIREVLFPGDRGQNSARQRAWKSTEFEHGFCRRCNAWNGQLGLEPTIELYAEHVAECYQGVWRLMADDGTVWLNLGDRYVDKELQGIPWAIIQRLKKDGWIWRADHIWWKRNNPVTNAAPDRASLDHEHVFLLTKNRDYDYEKTFAHSVLEIPTEPMGTGHTARFPEELVRRLISAGCPDPNGILLDPFGGEGTVGVVGTELGHDTILIELSPRYVSLTVDRIRRG